MEGNNCRKPCRIQFPYIYTTRSTTVVSLHCIRQGLCQLFPFIVYNKVYDSCFLPLYTTGSTTVASFHCIRTLPYWKTSITLPPLDDHISTSNISPDLFVYSCHEECIRYKILKCMKLCMRSCRGVKWVYSCTSEEL
jgi:hypothetical protein